MKYTVVGIWSEIDYSEENPLWNKSFVAFIEADKLTDIREAIKDYYYDGEDPKETGPLPPYEILAVIQGHYTLLDVPEPLPW